MRERVACSAGARGRAAADGGYAVSAPPSRSTGARAPPAMTIRVLIVDDQPLLRAGFRMILVGGAGPEGRRGGGRRRRRGRGRAAAPPGRGPDGHPDAGHGRGRGDAAPRRPRRGGPVKVLILTTFDLDEYMFEALRAGASGFLLKDTPPDELIGGDPGGRHAATRCSRRRSPGACSTGSRGSCRRRNSAAPQAVRDVTEREREVLLLVAPACPTRRSPSAWCSARRPSRPTYRACS